MKKHLKTHLLLLMLCLFVGCGSGDEGGSSELENGDPALSDIATQDVTEEDDGLCVAGTFKCEGFEVFRCITGGAWVYVELCENGLSCVAAIGGCACVPQCDGKTCGPDGCGDTCGECDSKTVCSPDGQCTDDCNPEGTGMLLKTKIWVLPNRL